MAYNTGSITSATPASALVAVIETELTAHAAWTFVEGVVIGSSTYNVWKCESASNFIGSDFYITLRFLTAGTGVVDIGGGEVYDSGANTMLRPITSVATAPTAGPEFAESATARALDHASTAYVVGGTLNTTGFTWYTVVGNSFFAWGCRVGVTNVGSMGGCFDTVVTPSGNDTFPIVIHSNAVTRGQSSRHPGKTAAVSSNFDMNFDIFDDTLLTDTVTPDIFHDAKPICTPVGLKGTSFATDGGLRGFLLDCVGINTIGSAITGDTITVGSDVYVCMFVCGSSVPAWFLKTAAS